MNSFFTLVGFEYKKIFKRKSAIGALVLVALASALSPLTIFFGTSYVDGEPFESHYQAMVKDRDYAMALSGRYIDEQLLVEARDAYSKIHATERYVGTPEYQQYARPYSDIYLLIRSVYEVDIAAFATMSEHDIQNFYQSRHERSAAEINAGFIGDASKAKLTELDSRIETPFLFGHVEGYNTLISCIFSIGIIGAFALAICLAPIFAGEYSTRADQLILSSRFGKKKLISAKLFTAISITVGYYLLLVAFSSLSCAAIYGFDGGNSPLQLLLHLCAYPLTMLDSTILFAICALGGTLLTTAVTLLLSSKLKSPFSAVIIVSVLLFVPMMLHVPETMPRLHNLFSLLPTCMMSLWMVISHVPFEFFGLVIPPYVFLPIFALTATAIMLPLARRTFRRNHH